jgi:ribonuclease HI
MAILTAFTDGAVRAGNPGTASCAWVLYEDTKESAREGRYLGPEKRTNNYAEYSGLIGLLEYLYKHKIKNVNIYSDSKLVVEQVSDRWDVSEPSLLPMWRLAYGLLQQGEHSLYHIKGHDGNEGNERADKLCNEVLDAAMATD